MNTLKIIIDAALTLIAGWQPNTSVQNDVEDAILAMNAAKNAGIALPPLAGAISKYVGNVPANMANLESGQLAEAFSTGASFNGEEDEILWFGVRKYKNSTPPVGSPAQVLKTMNGY